MLVLAVHINQSASAQVPLSMMILLDAAKNNSFPPETKCRMIVPTSGTTSISLWDAPDPEYVKSWCDLNVNLDCTHEVFQAMEDFSFGLSLQLAKARAAEKIGTNTKLAVGQIGVAFGEAQLGVQSGLAALEQRTKIVSTAREGLGKVREAAGKAKENEAVQSAVQSISTGVALGTQKAGSALSWLSSKVKEVATNINMPTASPTANTDSGNASSGYAPPTNGMTYGHDMPPSYDLVNDPLYDLNGLPPSVTPVDSASKYYSTSDLEHKQ
mmetsp:Transcript_18383/g.33477  ORF Transcript_18383/g.33477 Transcript_18383/m.33477 type:complete len:270 (-) Transcript_18383:637-1446(-)